jgi:hypothetical protein
LVAPGGMAKAGAAVSSRAAARAERRRTGIGVPVRGVMA